jgi:hypothetical protein
MIGARTSCLCSDRWELEDFSVFTDVVPGAMFNLGARIEGDERRHHNRGHR